MTDPPSTPTTPTNTTTPDNSTAPPSSSRRSARVHKRDPIVAPGFGTQNDLSKLSQELGLPQEAVRAVMESRGRGIAKEQKAPATPISTAWADFMQEEGVVSATTGASNTTTTAAAVGTASNTDTTSNDNADDKTCPSKSKKRTHELPLVPSWQQPFKKQKVTSSGILVQTGTLDSASIGRSKRSMDLPFDLMEPTVILPNAKITNIICGSNAAHAICIDAHGQVYGWGRNDASQLGIEESKNIALPTKLNLPEDVTIVDGAVGKSHTILLDSQHQLWAVGNNKYGQCSIRNFTETVPNFRKCVFAEKDIKIVKISCGEFFSVALSDQGCLYTTGSSEFGQLANGETGEYFVTASKIAFANCNIFTKRNRFTFVENEKIHGSASTDAKVVTLQEDVRLSDVACGKHHVVALEANNSNGNRRVFTWGCGDYGCLGHGVQKDEYYPRLVASLSALVGVSIESTSAGAHCSMVLSNHGHVYYWGKHRSVGEATMRPNLLEALANNGHIVTHCDGGAQTVVCCTQNAVTVSWGQGPHGELGYGAAKKSSSKPAFVSALDKCRVLDMACGQGISCFVVKEEDEQDKASIKKLAVIKESDVEGLK